MTTTTAKPKKKQAIDGRRINAFALDPYKLTIVGHDTDDGPEHPLYDERIKLPLEQSMIANFRALGVKNPIRVHKTSDGKLIVVDGRRRVLHAREANRQLAREGEPELEVPVLQEKGSNEDLEMTSISLNEHRVQDEATTKAAKAVRMLRRTQDNYNAVAIAFGVEVVTIKRWEKFQDLPCNVTKAVADGKITMSAAIKLYGLEDDDLNLALQELEQVGRPTVEAAERIAKTRKNGGSAPTPPKAPKKTLLRKLTKIEDAEGVSDDFLNAVRWVLGEMETSEIEGLESVLERL